MFERFILKATNANHARNRNERILKANEMHPVVNAIKKNKLKPKNLLEIGCSTGFVLKKINELTNAKCYGLDASKKAIQDGKILFKEIKLYHGILERSKLQNDKFEVIVLGFFLFLIPPKNILNLFNIIDKMLKDGGKLIIYDFYNRGYKKKPYKHNKNLSTFRWDFKKTFLSLPQYKLIYKKINNYKETNDKTEVSILQKKI